MGEKDGARTEPKKSPPETLIAQDIAEDAPIPLTPGKLKPGLEVFDAWTGESYVVLSWHGDVYGTVVNVRDASGFSAERQMNEFSIAPPSAGVLQARGYRPSIQPNQEHHAPAQLGMVAPNKLLKAGDRVWWDNCPAHCADFNPFTIKRVEDDTAWLDIYSKPVPLSELRRST